jgi:type IV fimbrial biogenesis protein FimT
VVILAILIAMATPSFREIGLNNRSTSVVNSLLGDLAVARSEAVKTARTAYVTSIGGDWSDGWEVWVDADGDGAKGADEPTLKRQDPVNGGYTSDETAFVVRGVTGATAGGSAISQIGFGAQGQSVSPNTGARFAICRPDGNAERSKGIQVSAAGRAQAVKDLSGLSLGCN